MAETLEADKLNAGLDVRAERDVKEHERVQMSRQMVEVTGM